MRKTKSGRVFIDSTLAASWEVTRTEARESKYSKKKRDFVKTKKKVRRVSGSFSVLQVGDGVYMYRPKMVTKLRDAADAYLKEYMKAEKWRKEKVE